ncbi:MAG: ABC transporter permease [Microbacteriaceae bacterium]
MTDKITLPLPQKPKKTFGSILREKPQLLTVPALFVIVVLLWEYGTQLIQVPEYILPKPSVIVATLVEQLMKPIFWSHVGITLQEAGLGFLIGVVVALVLGVLVARSQLTEKTIMPYVVAFQSVPKVALAPLFVVWFGFGLTSKIVMSAVIAFFPILINVIEGLKAVDKDKVEMLTSFGASEAQIFRMARFPSALPFIFAGLNVGAIFAILGAIVGEFIGAQGGLGYMLLQANYNFDIPEMFSALLVLSFIGLMSHLIITSLQRKYTFWAEEIRVATS